TLANLTAGTGIGISNGSGTISISNSGVTSLTGTTNQVSVSGSTGAVTLSLPQNINSTAIPTFGGENLSGALNVTTTTNQLVLGTGNTTTISSVAPGASVTATLPALSGSDTFAFLNQSQIFTNKTFTDNSTLFQDNGDNTKKLAFEVSNVPASTTVTLTAPNQNGTIAVAATGPIGLDASTGTISCATCLTTGS